MRTWIISLGCVAFFGCGQEPGKDIQTGDENPIVVRSRAMLEVSTKSRHAYRAHETDFNQPVTVNNAAQVSMTVDDSGFSPPTITNDVITLGTLAITALSDNALRVCGAGGNQKCATGLIRVFTTGVAGDGLWNADDAWGAPLTAALTTPLSFGLTSAKAAVLQTVSIAASKRVLRLADFAATPNYTFAADFTDAGAGDYSTTIVLEYALSL